MRGYMFRNRWFALLFVSTVLAGVTRMVGTEEEGGAIDRSLEQFARQRQAAERMVTDSQPPEEVTDVRFEFTPDEELIDPATGIDPTPVDEFAAAQDGADELVPDEQVGIVSQDDRQQAGQ